MSTRWYPLFQKGNPQLRVFLPNFWLKLIRPKHEQPPNVVQFACSMEMTKYDVRSYLEKIYNIENIIDIRTRIAPGNTKRDLKGYVVKEDDTKMAYVILDKNEKFEYPNIFPDEVLEKAKDEETKAMETAKNEFKKYLGKTKKRPGLPGWFSI